MDKNNILKPLIFQCAYISKSVNTSPRKFEDKSCYSSAVENIDEFDPINYFLNSTSSLYGENSNETIIQRTTSLVRIHT